MEVMCTMLQVLIIPASKGCNVIVVEHASD